MKNKAACLVLVVILSLPIFLGAQELQAGKIVSLDGKSWQEFSGFGDLRILLSRPYNETAIPRLERCAAIISSWTQIKAYELRAETSDNDGDSYIVLVSQLLSNNKDYSANLPSGLRLRFDGALSYDFRVKTSEYFIRVRGVLFDDRSLAAEVEKAATDPSSYITERDPAWSAERIAVLESSIEETVISIETLKRQLAANMNKGLFGPPKPVSENLIDLVVKMKAGNAKASRADASAEAKANGLKVSSKEIDAIFRVWFNE